jgi:hypothetical protein
MAPPTNRPTALSASVLLGLVLVLVAAAACSPGPPAGASPAVSPAGSADPSVEPSSSGSDDGPAATGGGGADSDAAAALDAFRAFVQTDQSFHMRADMLLTIGPLTLDMEVNADVAGGDEKGTIDVRGAGTSVHMDIVVVDGTAYGRIAQRDWIVLPADTSSSNPLLGLDVEGLEAVGIVNAAGQLAHHFRTDDVSMIDTSTITGTSITELRLDTVGFDVYVTDDGVPITAVMEFAGAGTVEDASQTIEATVRYDFSKFGEPVVIEPPI